MGFHGCAMSFFVPGIHVCLRFSRVSLSGGSAAAVQTCCVWSGSRGQSGRRPVCRGPLVCDVFLMPLVPTVWVAFIVCCHCVDLNLHRLEGFLFSDLLRRFDQSDQWQVFPFMGWFGSSKSFAGVFGFDFVA